MSNVYNFSAGPAVLPKEVLAHAQNELLDYKGTGMSVMELSHRSAIFVDIIERAEASLRTLMSIPDNYKVLFLQGGATSQFSMVPMNLFRKSRKADFINSGSWSVKAITEAKKFGTPNTVASSEDKNFTYYPETSSDMFSPDADYVHLTTNNTIFGTRITEIPDTGDIPIVADMSSNILSEPYNVEDFGLIYAGAQKNIGPAGATIVIIREDLVGHAAEDCPIMFDYQTHVKKNSAYNTPPTFAIYMAGLVFDWTIKQGGVAEMERKNKDKAGILYRLLDESDFYQAPVRAKDRSLMNVPFTTISKDLDAKFIAEAAEENLVTLKGHRSVGGMRASIYNPMPKEGVETLVTFMKEFEKKNG